MVSAVSAQTVASSAPELLDSGRASYYGPGFHGKRTANGEIFDMYAMTAAHKTLPFGTIVRVRNLDNGKDVIVRINDRGPFIPGRVIDVSVAAARILGLMGTGTARVQVFRAAPDAAQAVPASGDSTSLPGTSLAPAKTGETAFRIQVASYGKPANAHAAYDRLRYSGLKPEYERSGSHTRVILPEVPEYQLQALLRRLTELGFPGAVYSSFVK